MPRYFFNIVVRGRKAIPDPEGDLLANDKEAQAHALMVAREMMAGHHKYKRGLEHWTFVVTDKDERLVAVVQFDPAKSKKPRTDRRRA